MIKKNCQFLFSLSEGGPTKNFFACKFVQLSKDSAFHYHVEDFWTLNARIQCKAFVVNTHRLQRVAIKVLRLNLDDEFFRAVTFGFRSFSSTF